MKDLTPLSFSGDAFPRLLAGGNLMIGAEI